MQAEGAQTLFPLERLSLRGFLEVFPKLLGLLKLRYSLYRYFVRNPPSLFIGIDAPDFNFWLERKLKQRGVTVIHYVSPSIWAWRSGRIHAIKSAVSHVLALFPFEVPLYEKAGVSVSYVGHPLADSIAIEPEPHKQANDTPLIALLPGSRALKQQCPHLQFIGVAGPLMQAEGAQTLFPLERLSLRGFLEVFPKLLGLLKLRYSLYRYFVRNPPSLFIGIDAPDFNFWLERKLKQRGVTVIHYVSPSIWAWRSGRIHAIKSAVSHVLALFPFEVPLYEKAGVSVSYVGHPLADSTRT